MPSFFERLTGTNIEKPKTKPKPKTAKKKSNEKKAKKVSVPTSVEKDKKEDLFAETEGQLTIDVYQTPNEIVIKSTIAGVKPEDLDIAITNDMVTIKGTRKKDEEVKAEDYYYQECYWGAFSRSVILPVDVEAENATATMKNGILTIRLPKVEKVKTRRIVVKEE